MEQSFSDRFPPGAGGMCHERQSNGVGMAAKAERKVPGSRKDGKRKSAPAKGRGRPRRLTKYDGPDPIDIHVGSRLRLRRTIVGMSQTELAAKVGLTFQAIQKYEHGNIRISASRLYELAIALRVPIATFFEGLPDSATVGTGEAHVPENGDVTDRAALELVRTFAEIRDPGLRRLFIQFLRRAALLPADDAPVPQHENVTPIGGRRKDR